MKNADDKPSTVSIWKNVPIFPFSSKGLNSFMYNGTIEENIPVKQPWINRKIIRQ
jgi:hypothetical protein